MVKRLAFLFYSFFDHVLTFFKINKLGRDAIESNLTFAGFLVFHCPLKADAVDTLKMLADSSHRVRPCWFSKYDHLCSPFRSSAS